MASDVVLCSGCRILISEVLAYLWNKLKVIDEDTLIRISSTAFTLEEIRTAKKLLFEAVPIKRLRTRKNEEKSEKYLEDIIDLLKQTDATDPERLPIFVARELHRLPPVTFDHIDVTRLLRDLNLIREDLREIKSEYVTQKQLQETLVLTREKSVDYVNRRRGAFLRNSFNNDSGPMGLRHVNSESVELSDGDKRSEEYNNISLSPRNTGAQGRTESSMTPLVEANCTKESAITLTQHSESETVMQRHVKAHTAVSNAKPVKTVEGCSVSNMQPCENGITAQARSETEPVPNACASSRVAETTSSEVDTNSRQGRLQRSMADVVRASTDCNQIVGDLGGDWITVQRKKPLVRSRFVSEVGNASQDLKFKSAPNLVPLYISNVCKQTVESDIIEYIRNKT